MTGMVVGEVVGEGHGVSGEHQPVLNLICLLGLSAGPVSHQPGLTNVVKPFSLSPSGGMNRLGVADVVRFRTDFIFIICNSLSVVWKSHKRVLNSCREVRKWIGDGLNSFDFRKSDTVGFSL